MEIAEDIANLLDKIYDLADDSINGVIDLSEAMWEIRENIEELRGEFDE